MPAKPRTSLREFKKASTREALITAARKLFSEKGYNDTTLEEICDQVPIHVTTFFSYFASKEELAFAHTIDRLKLFFQSIRGRPPGVSVMVAWWEFFYSFGLRGREEEGAFMVRMEEVPALRNRYASIVRQYEEEVARALAEEAGRDPETDLYSKLYAATLLGTIVSGAHWHRAVHGAERGDTTEVTKLILARFPSRDEVNAVLERTGSRSHADSEAAATKSKPAPRKRVARKERLSS